MKWSEEVWDEAGYIYEAILRHPFVTQLAEGTLSRERFLFYIRQDAIYLKNYSRVLSHIAARLPDKEWREDFLKFASDGIMVENALHASFIGDSVSETVPTPACLLYTSYESAKAFDPVEVEVAAVLPCFWVYMRVGNEIFKTSSSSNPYSEWISTYADEAFAQSTAKAIGICDSLAENTTPDIREKMKEAFITATKMELMFWDSAYKMEKWII